MQPEWRSQHSEKATDCGAQNSNPEMEGIYLFSKTSKLVLERI
jgi:hypothetical protein